MTATRYIVVPAPGHYGDRTRVISSHHTAAAAIRAAAGKSWAVYEGDETKGEEWLRVYEQGRRRITDKAMTKVEIQHIKTHAVAGYIAVYFVRLADDTRRDFGTDYKAAHAFVRTLNA